ncbi:MAG: trehalose-6-phosphate synthase [Actinomycetota bacterium]|nr:trehalose-6-phosphate synthase [Actinomycetota bacterium]
MVSNRVPYKIVKSKNGVRYKKSVGGLVTALDPILSRKGGLWVGWNGLVGKNKYAEKTVEMDSGYSVKFLGLSKYDVKNFYHGFSNRTIWPLFHGFIFQSYFDLNYWRAYKKINKRFTEKVLEEIKGDEIIWVQDYHLMLMPSMLRKELPRAKIIFFLHIPFPCNEIFRVLPWDNQILEGLMGADLLGFQTSRDSMNFLYSCKQELKIPVDYKNGSVEKDNKKVQVSNFPISIDFGKFDRIAKNSSTNHMVREFKKAHKNVKLIMSVERLDYTKGIRERLHSIKRFFGKYPEYKKKVIFIQISVPSRTKIIEYRQFKREIDQLVGNINGEFADELWTPINYIYKTIPQEVLVSYYRASDVCLVTPLRDGMNLIAKEYVSCKPDGNGALVLSEFAGSAEEMHQHSIMVNPYDFEEVADGIKDALEMDSAKKRQDILALRDMVKNNDVYHWAERFLGYADKRG